MLAKDQQIRRINERAKISTERQEVIKKDQQRERERKMQNE